VRRVLMSPPGEPQGEDVAQAQAALQQMTNGYWVTQIIYVAAKLGGRERREDEYRALLAAANLQLARIIPTRVPRSVIEALPR
jgi:hypothetical protein